MILFKDGNLQSAGFAFNFSYSWNIPEKALVGMKQIQQLLPLLILAMRYIGNTLCFIKIVHCYK
jgi:hypothetical protein